MKRLKGKKVIVGCLLILGLPVYAQDTLRIDLENAIRIALDESPTVRVADKEVSKKEYAKKETIAQLFPTLSASGSYSHAIKKQTFVMGTQQVKVGTANTFQGGFNLALPVFAPALYKAVSLTGDDVNLAVELARSSRMELVNQVTKAYYQLLLAQDSYKVLQQSYDQAERNFEIVNNKFKQGVVSEYDKIRAEVQVHNLKPSLVSAKNAISLTRMQLQVLMGIDVDQPIAVNGNLADHEQDLLNSYLSADSSLESNTDLKQLDIQTKMLEKNVQIAKTDFMPTLSLTTQYSWMSMSENLKINHYRWIPYSTLGLSLNIPIVNISTHNKVKQSKIELSKMIDNRENLIRNLHLMTKSYQDNMKVSIEQLGSNKEGVKQAEKGQMIAQKKYEVGNGTILELNDSEVALTQAQLAYHQSIYDYLISKADLEKVLGKQTWENN